MGQNCWLLTKESFYPGGPIRCQKNSCSHFFFILFGGKLGKLKKGGAPIFKPNQEGGLSQKREKKTCLGWVKRQVFFQSFLGESALQGGNEIVLSVYLKLCLNSTSLDEWGFSPTPP